MTVNATSTGPPESPGFDAQIKRYMRARAVRHAVSTMLSGLVRLAYRGRLDGTHHSIIIPESSLSPWRFEEDFLALYEKIGPYSLIDEMRLYELWHLTRQLASTEGDILEVGVWRGGSGCLMAAESKRSGSDATVFLCDTFAGVVKAGSEDPIYSGGEHADTSAELVLSLLRYMGLDNAEVLTGIFPDETGGAIEDRTFKLCHLDLDVYESTREAALWLWPRLSDGAVVVVDDYGGDGMDGVRRAVHEIAEITGCRMIHNLNGHAILVKVPSSADNGSE